MPEIVLPRIPSIPPLTGISDRATRDVLSALVRGWELRNGQGGADEDRFVRRGEIDKLAVDSVRFALVSGAGGGLINTDTGIGGKSIGEIIAGITGTITESMLFKSLGDRINIIDRPGGLQSRVNEYGTVIATLRSETAQTLSVQTIHGKAIGDLEAGLLEAESFRLTNETAIAEAINTMWTYVTGSEALVQDGQITKSNDFASLATTWQQLQVQVFGATGSSPIRTALAQEAAVRATRDGVLEAQWTVKTDVNGYVSGFGLATTARGDTPSSKFIVRADSFAIGSPEGPGIKPAVPFIVLTTPTVIDGVDVPAGVYMTDVFIKNASIDTLKVRSGAITETVVASGGTSITGVITLPDTAEGVLAIAMATVSNFGFDGSHYLTLDGLQNGISLAGGFSGFIAGVKFISGGGTKSITSQLSADQPFTVQQHNLVLMGAKR